MISLDDTFHLPERIELYSEQRAGEVVFIIDLVDEDGRETLKETPDLSDALDSAMGFAEGDGTPADLIPIINMLRSADEPRRH